MLTNHTNDAILVYVPLIIICLLLLPPIGRILRRTGHSPWWCVLAVIPLANLIGLWVLAYGRWPAAEKATPGAFQKAA